MGGGLPFVFVPLTIVWEVQQSNRFNKKLAETQSSMLFFLEEACKQRAKYAFSGGV